MENTHRTLHTPYSTHSKSFFFKKPFFPQEMRIKGLLNDVRSDYTALYTPHVPHKKNKKAPQEIHELKYSDGSQVKRENHTLHLTIVVKLNSHKIVTLNIARIDSTSAFNFVENTRATVRKFQWGRAL